MMKHRWENSFQDTRFQVRKWLEKPKKPIVSTGIKCYYESLRLKKEKGCVG